MTCEEFCQQAGAWALDAVDAGEVEELKAHLRVPGEHHGCLQVLANAREVAAALAANVTSARPDPAVWDRIEKELGPATAAPAVRAVRRRETMAMALAAAASIAAVWLGVALKQERETHRSEIAAAGVARGRAEASLVAAGESARQASDARLACLKEIEALRTDSQLQKQALALLEDPSTKVVTFASQAGDGYRASALWNAGSGRAIVLSSGLVQKPGSDFELWVIRGKAAPQPAGFLRMSSDGTALGEISHALLAEGAPDAFAVSIEPAGGRTTPTQVVLVGAMKS